MRLMNFLLATDWSLATTLCAAVVAGLGSLTYLVLRPEKPEPMAAAVIPMPVAPFLRGTNEDIEASTARLAVLLERLRAVGEEVETFEYEYAEPIAA